MSDRIEMARGERELPYEAWHPDYAIYADQPAGPAGPFPKRPYRDHGCAIQGHPSHYYSHEAMAKEWERLWPRVWLLAGHLNDIPRANRFMKFDFGHESVVLVRGEGQEVRGFYNVCQHRGTRLVTVDYGSTKTFVCPFHQWKFSNCGKLLEVPARETFRPEALDRDLDLKKIHVDVWKGFIFISFADEPMPLQQYLGEEFREVARNYDLEKMVRLTDVQQEWPVNWKVGQEAFIEGYHVEAVHPQITQAFDPYHAQHDVYENGHSDTIFAFMRPRPGVPVPDDHLLPDHELALRDAGLEEHEFPSHWTEVRAAVIAGKRRNAERLGVDYAKFTDGQLVDNWQMGLFPNATLNTHAEGVLVQRWMPHPSDPEKMVYRFQVYALAGARRLPGYMGVPEGAEVDAAKVLPITYAPDEERAMLGPVLSQDRELVPRVQQGAHSKGFAGAVFCEQEIRIKHFYDEYLRLMES